LNTDAYMGSSKGPVPRQKNFAFASFDNAETRRGMFTDEKAFGEFSRRRNFKEACHGLGIENNRPNFSFESDHLREIAHGVRQNVVVGTDKCSTDIWKAYDKGKCKWAYNTHEHRKTVAAKKNKGLWTGTGIGQTNPVWSVKGERSVIVTRRSPPVKSLKHGCGGQYQKN